MGTKPVSVINFNVLGAPFDPYNIRKTIFRTNIRKRNKEAAQKLNTSNADIIALQEVATYTQYRIFKKHLTNYPYIVYQKFLVGPKGGLVIFSKIPIKKHSYQTFKNKGGYRNKSIVGHAMRNGILIAKCTDFPLYILNTQLVA